MQIFGRPVRILLAACVEPASQHCRNDSGRQARREADLIGRSAVDLASPAVHDRAAEAAGGGRME
jgi:hypothetical protein